MKTNDVSRMRILNDLAVGKAGILKTVAQPINLEIFRLLEMGMIEGAMIKLLRRGPAGYPLHISVCGTEICLSQKEASLFFVEPI